MTPANSENTTVAAGSPHAINTSVADCSSDGLAKAQFTDPQQEQRLLRLINQQMSERYESDQYIELPDIDPNVIASLANKKIVLVDDNHKILALWLPSMMVASQGCADFVHHTEDMSFDLLMSSIIKKRPDILFLDYNLAGDLLKGTHILRDVKDFLPNVAVFGLSGSPLGNNKLKKAGAISTYDKVLDHNWVLREVVTKLTSLV